MVWGIAGVIYLTKEEWDKAESEREGKPAYAAHMYDPRDEIWIYVNHRARPSHPQMKRYLLDYYEERTGTRGYTARITVIGKRPNHSANVLSDDDQSTDEKALSDDDRKLREDIFYQKFFGKVTLENMHLSDERKVALETLMESIKASLNNDKIANIYSHSKDLFVQYVDLDQFNALSASNTDFNKLGQSKEFRYIALDYNLVLELFLFYNAIFSTSDLFEEIGDSSQELFKSIDVISSKTTFIHSEVDKIPQCIRRRKTARALTEIALHFIIGHEWEHTIRHNPYIENYYKTTFGYFKDQQLGDSSIKIIDYKGLELGADDSGSLLSLFATLEYYRDNHEFDNFIELWYVSNCLLFYKLDQLGNHSSSSISSVHPIPEVRDHHLVNWIKQHQVFGAKCENQINNLSDIKKNELNQILINLSRNNTILPTSEYLDKYEIYISKRRHLYNKM